MFDGPGRRRPRIALTYDDGPTEHTEALLDELAAVGASATFFVTGDSVRSRPEVLRRIAADPNLEIGSHSMTHPDLWHAPDGVVRDEVVESARLITDVSGRTVRLFRPPRGHHDERSRRWAAECGQAIVLWTLTSMDWKNQSAQASADAVTRSARDGDVVLFHDSVATTVEATRLVLRALSRQGFEFVTVTELLGSLSAGEVYTGLTSPATRFVRRVEGRLSRTREIARRFKGGAR